MLLLSLEDGSSKAAALLHSPIRQPSMCIGGDFVMLICPDGFAYSSVFILSYIFSENPTQPSLACACVLYMNIPYASSFP